MVNSLFLGSVLSSNKEDSIETVDILKIYQINVDLSVQTCVGIVLIAVHLYTTYAKRDHITNR